MTQQLQILPSNATVDEITEVLRKDGGVIVRNMISSDVMDRFMADVQPYLDETPYGMDGFTGNKTRRCCALFAKSLASADLITQPQFHGVAHKHLVDDAGYEFLFDQDFVTTHATLQVGATQVAQIWPGQGAQPLHRDDPLHYRRHPGPDSQVAVIYAASDITEEMGATRVIPGSHLWDDKRKPLMSETVPAAMKKGDGLIYTGSVFHGGGENSTKDKPRTAILMSLALGYLRQEENQYLAVPQEMVKKYPKHVQELLGYKACPPFLGWVEMQEPSIVLEQEDFSVGVAQNIL